MTRPRILHVYKDYYPPVLGGIESTINLMAHGTCDEYDITVLVCSGSHERRDEVLDGIRVVRVPELARFASAPFSPAFPRELRKLAGEADLLHFHHPNPTGDIACLLARPSAPIVMTYHSDVVRQQKAMLVYGPIQERMMRRCQVIMPTSPNYLASSEWLQRHKEKCVVLPLGIDLTRFQRTPAIDTSAAEIRARYAGPLTIFVGRLRYYKGLEFLLRAMPTVPGHLLVVGTGPEQQRLRAIIAELQIGDRVHLLGDMYENDVVTHLYAADVFCMPSHLRSEALGLSQIEAMACGLPVVSTRIASGVPFVNQDGVTGISVAPESPTELSSALNQLHADAELRQQMGKAARNRAHEVFSAQRMCADLRQVYERVLSARAR